MKYITLALLFLSLSNCNTTNKLNTDEKSAQETTELNGSYLVTHLYGEDVSEHKITIEFDNTNNKISGFSGCNMYYCDYTISDSSFSIGIPGASKRYCEDTINLEKKFFKALSEVNTKKNDKSSLILFQGKAETIVAKKEN